MDPVLLLVEDDAVLRGGLKELFAREGYRVAEAASVREARQTGLPVLAVGSLYLAGEVLREYAPDTVYDL